MELELHTYLLLISAAFAGGFVDSIAGGGGIITVPALMAARIPPHIALATNKLQACFGSFTAAANYTHKDLVQPSKVIDGIIWTAIGAMTGAIIIQWIPADILNYIIPIMLVAIFIYMLLSPDTGHIDQHAIMKAKVFYCIMGLAIGFYDGFFGPGTGSFWTIGFVALMGFNLKKATGHTKVMNFTSNIVSLITFIIGGKVYYLIGLTMGLGQMTGAYLGSKLVVSKGTKFVRVFFLIVVATTIARIIYKLFNPDQAIQ
ncbi:MAG: TSUP family transporter [Phycisphaerae bacterium]|nr:TSUP family transporter [Phycisphaerae bacterium]